MRVDKTRGVTVKGGGAYALLHKSHELETRSIPAASGLSICAALSFCSFSLGGLRDEWNFRGIELGSTKGVIHEQLLRHFMNHDQAWVCSPHLHIAVLYEVRLDKMCVRLRFSRSVGIGLTIAFSNVFECPGVPTRWTQTIGTIASSTFLSS